MNDTELGTQNFRTTKKDSSSLCKISNPADSNSWGIPEFCKILNGFPGIPVKIHKILGTFMEFQSGSPSIYYRISSVVHWGGGGWIFSGIAHYTPWAIGRGVYWANPVKDFQAYSSVISMILLW